MKTKMQNTSPELQKEVARIKRNIKNTETDILKLTIKKLELEAAKTE